MLGKRKPPMTPMWSHHGSLVTTRATASASPQVAPSTDKSLWSMWMTVTSTEAQTHCTILSSGTARYLKRLQRSPAQAVSISTSILLLRYAMMLGHGLGWAWTCAVLGVRYSRTQVSIRTVSSTSGLMGGLLWRNDLRTHHSGS